MYGVSQVLDYTRERNVPIPLEFTEANNYMERIETLADEDTETILNSSIAYHDMGLDEIPMNDYEDDDMEDRGDW